MKVYRVSSREEAERAYPCTTESPALGWVNGLPVARPWFVGNLGQYVEGFHLETDDGQVIGHIYWASSETALAPYRLEDRVAFLYCEWVQRQHRGLGYMRWLFDAFVDFLRTGGYKGVLVEGTEFVEYMHSRHFAKRGFRTIRETEGGQLMYLPLSQDTVQVQPLAPRIPSEGVAPVEILVIGSLFCPVGASAVLYVRRVAAEFGDQVTVKEVPAGTEALARYGVANGIFLNGKARFFGPVSEDRVRMAIQDELSLT